MQKEAQVSEVLKFWFGEGAGVALSSEEQSARWFKKDVHFDNEIRSRFASVYDEARSGELSTWSKTPHGRLALIVVLDQFPRNMFRGTERMFESDALALREARTGFQSRDNEVFGVDGQVFFAMPFMHSESLAAQQASVAIFEEMTRRFSGDAHARAANSLDFAVRHRDIIERFGRFPHRNALVGRASTAEELEFLTQPGSSF